jgi:hypothetical protein
MINDLDLVTRAAQQRGADYLLHRYDPQYTAARLGAERRVIVALAARRNLRDHSHRARRWLALMFVPALVAIIVALIWSARADAAVAVDKAKTWRVVSHVFGPYGTAARAFGVSGCETGGRYNRGARNQSSGTSGIFQIHPDWIGRRIYWGQRSILVRNNLHGRWPNARYALFLSKGGHDWSHWAPVCRR